MRILILIFISLLPFQIFSQNRNDVQNFSSRIEADKPTIYLGYVCQNEKKIRLRMYNNTVWHINVWAEKSYFPTKKPIQLSNGNQGYAIPNDEEIPVYYYIEKDTLENIKKIKLPHKEPYYQGGGGRIASQDSVLFSVPIGHLRKGLKIYVEFSYEWEMTKSGDISKEPKHRAYFRSSDIGSANTQIAPIPCQGI